MNELIDSAETINWTDVMGVTEACGQLAIEGDPMLLPTICHTAEPASGS
ncbi:hypothetical protein [Specibacter cremeus]|nr:hypothetical protein [Specibacter cremeus]